MGFLYKQRYADSRQVPPESIPGLNVRHLQYIATRPGAVYNPGCGFSLWGAIEPRTRAANLNDLEAAKALLRQESERGRTIFRAIISLGEPEAGELGFYERSKWEPLVTENIREIARQMQIPSADLRWMAAMHRVDGHPHVHLLFWDAGIEPRQDFISGQRFQQSAERIRAGLNRSIYGDEIRNALEEGKAGLKDARLELRALFLENNPQASFSTVSAIKDSQFPVLAEDLQQLLKALPSSGSLKYQYLPPEYKAKVDAFAQKLLEFPCMSAKAKRYLDSVQQVCELYGNGADSKQAALEKAESKLQKDFGNEIMQILRVMMQELRQEAPTSYSELNNWLAQQLQLANDLAYGQLLSSLPAERIPWQALNCREDFRSYRTELHARLLEDARFRAQLSAFAKGQLEKAADHLEAAAAYRASVAFAMREADRQLIMHIYEDKSWNWEAAQTHCLHLMQRLIALLAQSTSQQRAKGELHIKRDLSKEARKDQKQKRSLADTPEFEL